jgi:hypothetical protein
MIHVVLIFPWMYCVLSRGASLPQVHLHSPEPTEWTCHSLRVPHIVWLRMGLVPQREGSTAISCRIHSPPETCCDGSRGSIQLAVLQTQAITDELSFVCTGIRGSFFIDISHLWHWIKVAEVWQNLCNQTSDNLVCGESRRIVQRLEVLLFTRIKLHQWTR